MHVPSLRCNRVAIAQSDGELADCLFDLLEHAQAEWIPINQAVPLAYARLAGALADRALDTLLRDCLDLDEWDHLSGFWKLVRRAETNRFRELDIATLGPPGYNDGVGGDILWAELGMAAGDRLKYVYDFGD